MRRERGFTLIEVLVALAIAAIGLAAVLGVVTNAARNAAYLHDKTFASWIALNRITTLRLAGNLPSVDKTDGDVDFAGGKWKWLQTVTQTEVPGIRRIDIAVRHDTDPADQPIATVTGFVGRTQVAGVQSTINWDYAGTAQAPSGAPGSGAIVPGATTTVPSSLQSPTATPPPAATGPDQPSDGSPQ
jgi:general secretion pathway protein I